MNLPTTKPNDRDLAWYVRECEALQCINAALRAQANDEFDAVITRNMELERENSKLWAELEKATCGKTTCSECGKPVNNAWRDEDGHHCLTCLADERNALRKEVNQLTADFRAQAKQLRQCNRELAQEVAGRKIREKLAAMQKEVAP